MTDTFSANGSFEVVVAGGGPAGAALAALLARDGHRCLILERANFPRYHVGGSLIPHTYGIFDRLGLLPKLKASHFPEKHSVRFVTASGEESTPFYFSERLPDAASRTWQVERSEFDRMLLDHAREQGVEVREGARAEGVLFENDRAVGARVAEGGQTHDLPARVIVDATGAATLIGRQLGLRSDIPTLRKGVLWAYYQGGARLAGASEL